MVDGLFFISSALNVKQLSVFNNEERFKQTVETIKSIDKYCPSNVKYIFDTSYELPNEQYLKELHSMGIQIFFAGNHHDVKMLSESGQRSLAETLGFILFLNFFRKKQVEAKRIFKMSGRYKLNDNFVPFKDEFKDSFVFLPTVNSWMPKSQQEAAGVDRIFELRLWHMDYNLLDTFQTELYNIIDDMSKYGIDVEHSYYKNLNKYNWTTIDPIGLEGAIAPTGEIINE
jgi:hypothetical protein